MVDRRSWSYQENSGNVIEAREWLSVDWICAFSCRMLMLCFTAVHDGEGMWLRLESGYLLIGSVHLAAVY